MTDKKTIVFDWGDTLMQTFPDASGPMVFWPEVAEVKGAAEALGWLKADYHLILATNASDSTANQVRMALARVGLDIYIQEIFTFHELGFRKPNHGFFRQIETILGTKAEDMVLVGDSYLQDVMGAYLSRWKTIWFNPQFQYAPGLAGLHDYEIYQLDELSSVLQEPGLPDWQTCQKWYLENSPSTRLWLHVQMVASVAYALALWIRKNGQEINPLLAQRGGLVHDVNKLTINNREGRDHGEMGGEWLAEQGQPLLAEITRRHILDAIIDENRRPRTLEEKVVYFADKLCDETRIVTLDTRISALKERYPHVSSKIEASVPALNELQKELARAAGIEESKLVDKIRQVTGRTT